MSKRTIFIIFIASLVTISFSLYATYAIDEETAKLEDSTAKYNLVYSLKEKSNREVSISSKEEKYVDISFKNDYESTVKYGVYYRLTSPNRMPENVSISVSLDSKDQAESTINSGEVKTVTIKIVNNSENNIDLVLGTLIGFENGNIADLIKNGEILIK